MNTYDEVPYTSQAFAQTHPDRLATTARIFGLAPPDVDHCRVLELGCASGGNLIPMACALPCSEFVGVDLSARQVQQGRERIAALGLRNVRIEHASILDIDAGWGCFDYQISHGVFSWVDRAVQDKILQLAAEQLADNGVAYVSYNTYPGWHLRESVRDMMRYHAMPFDEPAERIEQARELLNFLTTAVPPESGAWGQMLHDELALLRQCADGYLYHEHLEPINTPLYFHQFIECAANVGLQYLAEADFASMLATRFPPAVARTLEHISADIVHLEQYMDFVRQRRFRQTLLCKRGQRIRRALSPAVLEGLYLASAAHCEAPTGIIGDGPAAGAALPDLRPGVEATFRTQGSAQVTTSHPMSKAALALLCAQWPLGWPTPELINAARQLAAVHLHGEQHDADTALVMQDLFQCFLAGVVELRSAQPACVNHVSVRPLASAWARQECAAITTGHAVVPGARNESVSLEPFSRALLPLLDGTRDHTSLQVAMLAEVAAGHAPWPQDVPPQPDDDDALRNAVALHLNQSLTSFARHALLVS